MFKHKRKAGWVGLLVALVFVFTSAESCDGSPSDPAPDSDSSQVYEDGAKIPTDTKVYTIKGVVNADASSLTRQVSPAHGSTFGIASGGTGYLTGSYFGEVQAGKGFVRLTVETAEPSTDLAPPDRVVVLKMSDTKGTVLRAGDEVTLKCRRQYEAVAAVQDNQKFDAAADGTWELDYCRLATPVLGVPDKD